MDEMPELDKMNPQSSLKFSDKEGIQPYSDNDLPPDREVLTTPYDAHCQNAYSGK